MKEALALAGLVFGIASFTRLAGRRCGTATPRLWPLRAPDTRLHPRWVMSADLCSERIEFQRSLRGERVPELTSADRQVLPIPDRPYDGPVFEDAKDPDTSFPPIEPLRPPAGAPNVLIVLLDDAGFGSSSAFGGRVRRPRPSVWPVTG